MEALDAGRQREHRPVTLVADESKIIGMCVKGGAPTTSLSSGLFSFTLPSILPTNSAGSGATGFAGPSPSPDFNLLQNPFSLHSRAYHD
ncbi:MAG: hypothetical protein ACLFVL_07645 [Candidatus Aenigmatarchaeota archaeon]